ncbi:MAG TPA: SigE family RNA polymerase sigma factor [Trebonia sp.]|jgi:RNA polymerase sigma-70 factor (sigma-E family)|nr:SigE family RNA polymerase sigma factor [Trebonia sp.]
MPGDDETDESFDAFVRERGERHLRVAVLITGDWHAAEDLVQASLVKLYRAWPGIDREDGDPDAYLRRVIVNTHRSWWRARWRRETPVAELPDSGYRDEGERLVTAAVIRQALLELPRRQRAVVVLRYFEDLPEAEVASLLGCTVGTVKTHASRGLRALRSRLGDQWPGTGGAEPPGDTARRRTIGRAGSANGGQLAHCTTGLHA